MKVKILFLNILFTSFLFSQNKDSFLSKLELSVNYGLAGNFFVDYGLDVNKDNENIIPLYSEIFDEFQLYQKNFIGTSGGFSLTYNFNRKNALSFSFDRNVNNGKYKGSPVLSNGTSVFINDFVLRHRNHFYSLSYRRSLNKNNNFYASIGINYLRHNQAEINIAITDNFVLIEERNYENSYLEEGGFVFGLEKYFFKSGQFEIGVQSKLFILTTSGLETITFTPILRFLF